MITVINVVIVIKVITVIKESDNSKLSITNYQNLQFLVLTICYCLIDDHYT